MSLNNWKGQSEDLVIEIKIVSLEYACRVCHARTQLSR
jgi:hypothetical protein